LPQPKKPYLVDAITGNSRYLASHSRTGRIYRLWWPNINYPQHVKDIRSGLFIDGQSTETTWFDSEESGWEHQIEYIPLTNILKTTARSMECSLEASIIDFAVPNEDTMIRHYSFRNTGDHPVSFRFIYYSAFEIAENQFYNATQFDEKSDALSHFRHLYVFSVCSSHVCSGYQAGHAWDNAKQGQLNGNSIDMASDGALSWNFTSMQPGQQIDLPIYIAAGSTLDQTHLILEKAKSKSYAYWYDYTANYWHSFLQSTVPCPLKRDDIIELYQRSLLTMKLMSDESTGSIIAAPEFDEHFSRCGGYAYCWGRDAAFITTALDKSGLTELSRRFYEWTRSAQDSNGAWQQRHFHDGRLAPSWGLQIDEGASILWGMWEHYKHTLDSAFAEQVWPSVQSGAQFLLSCIDEETGLPRPSMDLWEERLAEHTYSAGAVYGGLMAAASFALLQGRHTLAENWKIAAKHIRESITEHCWNEEGNSFYRGLKLKVTEDEYKHAQKNNLQTAVTADTKGYPTYWLQHDTVVDISLLGLAVPFGVFSIDDPRIIQTADTIEHRLKVPDIGGIKRYEDDAYIGGNPWILTTLWLAHYRTHQREIDKAMEILQWVLNHRTEVGLLPEQIDRFTGQTAWVVPLTWSHAMYVLAVHLIAEKQ
jgi:glucoamylase